MIQNRQQTDPVGRIYPPEVQTEREAWICELYGVYVDARPSDFRPIRQ